MARSERWHTVRRWVGLALLAGVQQNRGQTGISLQR
jgi:hypothetical protein